MASLLWFVGLCMLALIAVLAGGLWRQRQIGEDEKEWHG